MLIAGVDYRALEDSHIAFLSLEVQQHISERYPAIHELIMRTICAKGSGYLNFAVQVDPKRQQDLFRLPAGSEDGCGGDERGSFSEDAICLEED
jgi:hypothetical protein